MAEHFNVVIFCWDHFIDLLDCISLRSKNSKPLQFDEKRWLELVKMCPCVVTGAPPPSEAHHTEQGNHFTTVALSKDAHTGKNGWHGDKTLWRIYKVSENDAINRTVQAVFELLRRQL